MSSCYRFGIFTLELSPRRLLRGDTEQELQPLVVDLLLCGVQAPGEVLSREELRERLWPDVRVSENSLHQLVSKLRRALGEYKSWWRTVPGRGYTFDAPVSQEHPTAPPTHHLPASRDSFVGRHAELSALLALLDSGERLISLLGTGGAGKSRLAQELGHTTNFAGGVWFIRLAEARTVEDIYGMVARTLQIRLEGSPQQQLQHAIAARGRALFILDNFEQLTQFAQQTVGHWLDWAPEACFLITSRHALRLRGERTVGLEGLAEEDAVELFADRAQLVDPEFKLPVHAEDVTALVRLLDRLPLAIELAAARSRLFAPAQLLVRMRDRFVVLKSRSHDLPPRQRTLQALLSWSWELLSAEEQAVLAQCSVFEGGMSLDAAASVLVPVGDTWIEDILCELLDKSLLVRNGSDQRSPRLSMLISIQDFALSKLANKTLTEQRHGQYFAQQEAADAEQDNLAIAAWRAIQRGDETVAVACALRVSPLYEKHGPLTEGVRLLDAVLSGVEVSARQRVQITQRLAELWKRIGDMAQAETLLEDALSGARALPDRTLEQALLSALGLIYASRSEYAVAGTTLTEALAICRELGDRHAESRVLSNLGMLHRRTGELAAATAQIEKAAALFRAFGDRRSEAYSLANLALLYEQQGQSQTAHQHFLKALDLFRGFGERQSEANCLVRLGNFCADQKRTDEAHAYLQEALGHYRTLGDRRGEGHALNVQGKVFGEQGRPTEARRCFLRALDISRDLKNPGHRMINLSNLGELHHRMGQYAVAADYYERSLDIACLLKHRPAEALALSGLAQAKEQQGDRDAARSHYQAALALADETAEGFLHAKLGWLLLQDGELLAAQDLLLHGERLIRARPAPYPLTLLLCYRALLAAQLKKPEEADHFLTEAVRAATPLVHPPAELQQTLARVRSALSGGHTR